MLHIHWLGGIVRLIAIIWVLNMRCKSMKHCLHEYQYGAISWCLSGILWSVTADLIVVQMFRSSGRFLMQPF